MPIARYATRYELCPIRCPIRYRYRDSIAVRSANIQKMPECRNKLVTRDQQTASRLASHYSSHYCKEIQYLPYLSALWPLTSHLCFSSRPPLLPLYTPAVARMLERASRRAAAAPRALLACCSHTRTALSLSSLQLSLGCASRRSPRLTRRPHDEPNDPFSAGAGGSPRPSSRQEAPKTHPLQSQLARLSRPPFRYRPASANRALRPSCTSGPAHHDDEISSSREAISSS